MKKVLLVSVVIGILVIALSVTGFVYAQVQTPPGPDYPGRPSDGSSRRGHGMMGGYQGSYPTNSGADFVHGGLLHEYMTDALANTFGLTQEELQAKYDAGENSWQIAESIGLSAEEFRTLMLDFRSDAINQALADGVIPQEQAEWMLDRMNQMPMVGLETGYGPCHGSTAQRGNFSHGPGWRWNDQVTP
ncbi:MAG: hypothetical protein MUO67_14845 [Anaerolineales bacterium]|nr:hypothetical protein [Anaerolineales bacterium]